MMDNDRDLRNMINRRQFVGLTGMVGATALAGCTGNSDDGSSKGGSGDKKVHDVKHVDMANQVPQNIQWNISNPSSAAQISHYYLFDAFAKYNYAKSKLVPYGITDWEFGDNTFKLTLRDGLTWANGDDVTADDIVTQLKLGMYTGSGYGDYTKSVEAKDDKTVVMHLENQVNKSIVKFQVLSDNQIRQPKSVFGKYVDKIEKNEKDGTRALQDFAWKEPIASGPFEFKQATTQELVLTRRDDHPDSKNINFKTYAFRYINGNEQAHQSMIANQLDSVYSMFTPPRIVNQLPKNWQQVKTPANWGYGLVPQMDHKHTGDRAVRQAIAYVINRDAVVKNAAPESKQAPKYSMGIPSGDQERILGDSASKFETYGQASSETDKAAKVLKKAGYKKQGGKWHDSDGDIVNLPVQVPSDWTDWVTAAQTIVDQLKSFGFKSSVDSRSYGTLSGQVWANGDFVLASGSWLPGGAQASFPYFSLRYQLLENSGYTYNYPPANQSRGGKHADATVPSRTGSGKMTINPAKRLQDLSQATDEKKINEIILDLAWVTNQDLPILAVAEKQDQSFLSRDHWEVPEDGSDIEQVKWPESWAVRFGKNNYKP